MLHAVKRLLRPLVPARIYDPCRQPSYSQDGEDRILARVFDQQTVGCYVDVGAHHPRRFSNTYLFYRRGWQGINIDATPGSMGPFRRERPRDLNLEIGVAEQPGTLRFHVFDEPALNTFDAARAARLHSQGPYRVQRVCPVAVAPLRDILRDHLPPQSQIDLLTVDVEGADLAVLRSNDWQSYRPRAIVVEDCSDLQSALTGPTSTFLGSVGYRVFAKTATSLLLQAG